MPHLATYVGLADHSEQVLADSFRAVAEGHAHVADVHHPCLTLAGMSDEHRRRLAPVVPRYGEDRRRRARAAPRRGALPRSRPGEVGLLRDLQDLHLLATLVQTTWTRDRPGRPGLRDRRAPRDIASPAMPRRGRQLAWLTTRMKAAAAQALIVAP